MRQVKKLTAHSAIVDASTPSEATMQALQLTGILSLGCFAIMLLLYGEILLLQKN
tara:strand:+ start:693 stop:857 length:165 start_codon:yes stop_codon:yes gene_type:complete